jgi:Copine
MEAHKSQQNMYSILLIVTDGEIHDMPLTKRLLVDGSHLPLSVIIVGVGLDNFEMMRELDADGTVLRAPNNEAAVRDLV